MNREWLVETNKTGSIFKETVMMEVPPSYFCVLTIQLIKEVEKILDVSWPLWSLLGAVLHASYLFTNQFS